MPLLLGRASQQPAMRGGGIVIPFNNMPALRTRMIANQRAIWGFIGDSLTAGWGAKDIVGGGGGAGDINYNRQKSWVQQLSVLLNAAGILCRADAVFGNGNSTNNTAAEYAAANPQVTFGTGWGILVNETAGGGIFEQNTNGQPMTVTPEVATDSIEYYIVGNPGGGTATITDANGTLTGGVIAAAGDGLTTKYTATRTPSTLPISIQKTGGGTLYVCSGAPFNSAAPRLELWNMGWGGSTAQSWLINTNSWNPRNRITALAMHQATITLGANEAFAGTAAATYQANLQSIINAIIGTTACRLNKTAGTLAGDKTGFDPPDAYRTAIDTLDTNNSLVPGVNFYALAKASADYNDLIHRTEAGYGKQAAAQFADCMV